MHAVISFKTKRQGTPHCPSVKYRTRDWTWSIHSQGNLREILSVRLEPSTPCDSILSVVHIINLSPLPGQLDGTSLCIQVCCHIIQDDGKRDARLGWSNSNWMLTESAKPMSILGNRMFIVYRNEISRQTM